VYPNKKKKRFFLSTPKAVRRKGIIGKKVATDSMYSKVGK
jgi:hypothetical protein